MNNKMLFGNALAELLELREWTASKLSREINVDASYVRKWIRGERTPSLKSEYVEKIAMSIENGLSNKAYAEFIKTLGYEAETRVLEILKEAQINSLELGKNSTTSLKGLKRLLSSIPSFVHGKEEVFKYVNMLFKAAYESKGEGNKNILMTFQGERDILDGYEKTHEYFISVMSKLLLAGWRLKHLWRLKNNDTRTATLVRNIIEVLSYDVDYEPRYFTRYGTLAPPNEFIIIGDMAAIFFVADESSEYISSAFFYTNKQEVLSLKKHVELMLNQTKPVISLAKEKNAEDLLKEGEARFLIGIGGQFELQGKKFMHGSIKEILFTQDLDDKNKLANIAYNLESIPNYEVALINSAHLYKNIPRSMIIREGAGVFVKLGAKNFMIEEPITISGFKDFFESIWAEIPEVNKERERNLNWIRKRYKY